MTVAGAAARLLLVICFACAAVDAARVYLRETPSIVVVASKNYDELGDSSESHLSGPLRVVSTNYDSSDNSIHMNNRWGGLGKSVPDALAGPGYVVASRTGACDRGDCCRGGLPIFFLRVRMCVSVPTNVADEYWRGSFLQVTTSTASTWTT